MKRDTNIIPLSHDHHHGLSFCRKVRRGIEKGVGLERVRPYVLYFFSHHLEKHFREEEELLLDGLKDPLSMRAMEEHRRIRELVASIEGGGANQAEHYRALADLVENHIRWEERQLFPFLEESLSQEQLSAVGAALGRLHAEADPNVPHDLLF